MGGGGGGGKGKCSRILFTINTFSFTQLVNDLLHTLNHRLCGCAQGGRSYEDDDPFKTFNISRNVATNFQTRT